MRRLAVVAPKQEQNEPRFTAHTVQIAPLNGWLAAYGQHTRSSRFYHAKYALLKVIDLQVRQYLSLFCSGPIKLENAVLIKQLINEHHRVNIAKAFQLLEIAQFNADDNEDVLEQKLNDAHHIVRTLRQASWRRFSHLADLLHCAIPNKWFRSFTMPPKEQPEKEKGPMDHWAVKELIARQILARTKTSNKSFGGLELTRIYERLAQCATHSQYESFKEIMQALKHPHFDTFWQTQLKRSRPIRQSEPCSAGLHLGRHDACICIGEWAKTKIKVVDSQITKDTLRYNQLSQLMYDYASLECHIRLQVDQITTTPANDEVDPGLIKQVTTYADIASGVFGALGHELKGFTHDALAQHKAAQLTFLINELQKLEPIAFAVRNHFPGSKNAVERALLNVSQSMLEHSQAAYFCLLAAHMVQNKNPAACANAEISLGGEYRQPRHLVKRGTDFASFFAKHNRQDNISQTKQLCDDLKQRCDGSALKQLTQADLSEVSLLAAQIGC